MESKDIKIGKNYLVITNDKAVFIMKALSVGEKITFGKIVKIYHNHKDGRRKKEVGNKRYFYNYKWKKRADEVTDSDILFEMI